MLSETFYVTAFIVFNMLFAVVIGRCVYNFMFIPIMPVEIPSVKFVLMMLPKQTNEIAFMLFTLAGSAILLFVCTPIFVFITRDIFMFKALCALGVLSIFLLIMFIHTMKKYEVRAMSLFTSKYAEYVRSIKGN